MRHGESELVKERAEAKKLLDENPELAKKEKSKSFEEKEREFFNQQMIPKFVDSVLT